MTETTPTAGCEIRAFAPGDIEAAVRLWSATEGLGVGPGDTTEALMRFLERNPGLSLVAVDRRPGAAAGGLAAAVLCGHDGRRGFVYRLAVAKSHRRSGLAAELARRCFAGLAAAGIERCIILVQEDNVVAREFWRAVGGRFRRDLVAFSKDLP
jgi:ribosomal protein S18 acetylase RimI-like enzyme